MEVPLLIALTISVLVSACIRTNTRYIFTMLSLTVFQNCSNDPQPQVQHAHKYKRGAWRWELQHSQKQTRGEPVNNKGKPRAILTGNMDQMPRHWSKCTPLSPSRAADQGIPKQ